jgi:uncharacterized membrane protein
LNLPHLHLLLNHWPIIGTFIGVGLLFAAFYMRSEDIKQVTYALFGVVALMAIPAYLSGNAADSATSELGFDKQLVASHEGAALLAFIFLELTGVLALWGLWRFARSEKDSVSRAPAWVSPAVFLSSIVTAGLMTLAGTTGGDIRHPEIIAEGEQASAIAGMGASLLLSVRYFVIDYSRWVWPLIEAAHFLGLILILGAVGLLNIRMLGFFKQIPVKPLHRLLPWGIAGLIINVITGFMFFIGMPYFYTGNAIFQWKILLIFIAGANLLLFHFTGVFRKWEKLGAGDDAPMFGKLVAVTSVVLWIAIVVIGRYIPLGEGAG